jgi:hypothetical protein
MVIETSPDDLVINRIEDGNLPAGAVPEQETPVASRVPAFAKIARNCRV